VHGDGARDGRRDIHCRGPVGWRYGALARAPVRASGRERRDHEDSNEGEETTPTAARDGRTRDGDPKGARGRAHSRMVPDSGTFPLHVRLIRL
jgi:hypothetical protein